MNRRKFFNFLGSAVIGTVIALKLPDSLIPIGSEAKKVSMIELWPKIINDIFFAEIPDVAHIRKLGYVRSINNI